MNRKDNGIKKRADDGDIPLHIEKCEKPKEKIIFPKKMFDVDGNIIIQKKDG